MLMKEKLDKYLEEAMYYYDLPGLCVTAGLGDETYRGAVGYKNFETKEKLTTEHVFHMASVSKLFTGTAIMQLCHEGKLSVDDKIAEVLPYLYIDDERFREITIRQMLTHTSAIADVEDYCWDRPQTGEDALKGYVMSDEVRDSKLLWDPKDNKFRYSNIAYEILGALVAEVSGISFEEYVEKNIFRPLGMDNSEFLTFRRTGGSLDPADIDKTEMAMPHIKDEAKHIVLAEHYPYNREHGPSSTFTTDSYDIEKWAKAHLCKRILPPGLYDSIWQEYALVPNNGEHMGLSWFMRKQHGYILYGHEGTDDGFRASFWICPQLHAYIAVCTNISKGPVKKINKKIFDIITHHE